MIYDFLARFEVNIATDLVAEYAERSAADERELSHYALRLSKILYECKYVNSLNFFNLINFSLS